MADAKASEAARELVRARWGTTKLDGAVDVVVERAAQLHEAQRARLLSALDDDPAQDDGGDAA